MQLWSRRTQLVNGLLYYFLTTLYIPFYLSNNTNYFEK